MKLLLNYGRDKLDESSLEKRTFESNIAETKSNGEMDRITRVSFHPLAKPDENLLSKNFLVDVYEPRANPAMNEAMNCVAEPSLSPIPS